MSFNEYNEAFAYIDGGIYRREGSALVVYNSYGRELAVLADGVEYIEEWAFIQNDSLTGVYIPKSLNSLNAGAFMFCSNLSDIYYEGSEDEWNEIHIGDNGNGRLTGATRYYYSESEPTEEGNFWHYVDGVPTKWE